MLINYHDQALDNWVCLFEDPEYKERCEVFLLLHKIFNKENVKWAIGCSMNLYIRGIVDEFHDIDFIVDINSIQKIKTIMYDLGAELKETGGNGFCESDVYLHYQFGRVDVDIISGFRLITFGTSYYYAYDEKEIDNLNIGMIDDDIPLISLEAMYILYYMMEGWQKKRQFKRKLIEEYFQYNEIKYREIFNEALEKSKLPGHIRCAIKLLINQV